MGIISEAQQQYTVPQGFEQPPRELVKGYGLTAKDYQDHGIDPQSIGHDGEFDDKVSFAIRRKIDGDVSKQIANNRSQLSDAYYQNVDEGYNELVPTKDLDMYARLMASQDVKDSTGLAGLQWNKGY